MGVGGSVLSVLTKFLIGHSTSWFTELFSILENKLYDYADDSTLVAVIPCPDGRVAVTEFLNRGLNRISMWCDLLG